MGETIKNEIPVKTETKKEDESYLLCIEDFRFGQEKLIKCKKFLKTYEYARCFLFSEYYLALICIATFLCWFFKKGGFGLAMHFILLTIIIAINKDLSPAILIIISACMVIPESVKPEVYFGYIYYAIPAVISLIFHFIVYKTTIKSTGMMNSQVAWSVAMLFGGIFCMDMDKWNRGLPFYAVFGPLVLIADVVFSWYMDVHKTIDLALYFSKLLMWNGLILSAQTITLYIRSGKPFLEVLRVKYQYLIYGWGVSNNVGTLLLFAFPMCFYLSTRYKFGFVYILIGLLEFFTLLMTSSRGSVLAGVITIICSIIMSICYSYYKKWTAIVWGGVVIIGLLAICIFSDLVEEFIESIFKFGLDDNGRDPLYEEALSLFKEHPIFGVGIGYKGKTNFGDLDFYWFHCTIFQVMANFGCVGLLAYLYHYYQEGRLIALKWKNQFNWFCLFSALGYEIYSMIDTGTFVIPTVYVNMFIFTVLSLVNKDNKNNKSLVTKENMFYTCGRSL